MTGKSKCKILKEIRREIARNNSIEFVTSECKFQGDCTGTCPKCEAEVRFLEQELLKRQRAGKAVVLAGLTATLTLSALGCAPKPTQVDGDIALPETSQTLTPPGGIPEPSTEDFEGLAGVPVYPEPSTEPTLELMGDLPLNPDDVTTTPPEEIVMGEPAPGYDFP